MSTPGEFELIHYDETSPLSDRPSRRLTYQDEVEAANRQVRERTPSRQTPRRPPPVNPEADTPMLKFRRNHARTPRPPMSRPKGRKTPQLSQVAEESDDESTDSKRVKADRDPKLVKGRNRKPTVRYSDEEALDVDPDQDYDNYDDDEDVEDATTIQVNGERFNLITPDLARNRPIFTPLKLWNKRDRVDLDPETHQVYYKAAADAYLFGKYNKFDTQDFRTEEDGSLKRIHSLSSQLSILREHLIKYDMIDVFTIVRPIDVYRSPERHAGTYDLFVDHYKLTENQVAVSNAWWRLWVDEPYIQQNLQFSKDVIHKNTSDSLHQKILEDQDGFADEQRGGPLDLFLILKRIRSSSETALDQLKTSFKRMKISEIPGEDVDIAVSFVKSTHKALVSASRDDRNFVPDDFVETLYKVYQTSTIDPFNRVFRDEKELLLREADKRGITPRWPDFRSVNSLATATYARLKADGQWDVPEDTKKKSSGGYVAGAPGHSKPKPTGPGPRGSGKCFNCGSRDHYLPDCPKPRDEDKIAKNRQAYSKSTPKHGGKHPRRKLGPGGKPMILNKNGAYVLDQKKARESSLTKTADEATKSVIKALTANTKTGSTHTSPTPEENAPTVTLDPEAIRAALGQFLHK